jgi:hypothetical protein
MEVTVSENLAVTIGDRSAQLRPGEAFRLAENLIRRATVRMIAEEVTAAEAGASRQRQPATRVAAN